MGVLDRIRRILSSSGRSDEGDEDPEKTLDRLLKEMGQVFRAERLELAAAVRDLKRVERDKIRAEQEAAAAQNRARQALSQGQEDRAREHLRRKVECLEFAATLEKEREVHGRSVEAMRESLGRLEERIRRAQTQRRSLLSRKRRLEAIERYRRRLPPEMADAAISRALSQLRDRVEVMEITEDPDGMRAGGDDELERRFAELEAEVAAEGGSVTGVEDLKRLLLEEDDEADSSSD